MDLKNLIEKTEIQRKTILELITKAEAKEEVFKEIAVERFLKGFLTDLKNVEKHLTEQYAINGVRIMLPDQKEIIYKGMELAKQGKLKNDKASIKDYLFGFIDGFRYTKQRIEEKGN